MSLSISIPLSRPQSSFLPPLFSLFYIKLLFAAQYPNMVYFSSFPFCVCTNLSALPPHVFRLQPRLTSQLYVGLGEISPPPTPFVTLLPPPYAAGHGERKNEETKHFRLYTARGKAVVWCPLCCVRQDCFVCLAYVCVFFTSSTLNSDR